MGAVGSIVWLGLTASAVGSPLTYGACEPVLETCRADARVIAGSEALIVHSDAVVERLGIGDYRPGVPGCVQELPHEFVLTDRFGTSQLDRAVQGLRQGRFGHDCGDVIRHNGLHQNGWKPNRLPFSRRLGDATHELEELRGTDDRVRNRGSLDQIFLSHLRAEVTAGEQAVGPDGPTTPHDG